MHKSETKKKNFKIKAEKWQTAKCIVLDIVLDKNEKSKRG
jgi:hypothetical protein